MLSKNLYDQNIEEIFIRPATKKEKLGGSYRSKGFLKIIQKEGYEIVYKPYGYAGAGYYYYKITE